MLPSIQLAPAPPHGRGATSLAFLPIYYTSESFVGPLRRDVSKLLEGFASHFVEEEGPPYPFTEFKTQWTDSGWNFMHLKCIEARSRVVFLETVFRVFIENIKNGAPGSVQAGALFGLYTFFSTQPPPSSGQYGLNKIPVAIDTYQYIMKLPDIVPSCLQDHVLYVLHKLTSTCAFTILPESSLHPYSTRDLPNATVTAYEYAAKGGRPSKSQRIARARAAVSRLGNWVDLLENPPVQDQEDIIMVDDDEDDDFEEPVRTASSSKTPTVASAGRSILSQPSRTPLTRRQEHTQMLAVASTTVPDLTPPDLTDYITLKASLKRALPVDILRQAEKETKETMRGVEEYATRRGIVPDNGWGGLKRMEQQKSMLDFVKAPESVGPNNPER
ncbi:hypothetical protein FRB94_002535 [Tulasnella sp. JGI-2019a]|nr:hypothetical protein FRB94_002535 [Tulasnella sp. JGI-2019a]